MTQKHTPGPWEIHPASTLKIISRDEKSGAFVTVADAENPILLFEQVTANASLIAAAPDLLAALRCIVGDNPAVQGGICQHCGRDYLGDIEVGNGEATQMYCPSDDCPHSVAIAAIAKAEGR